MTRGFAEVKDPGEKSRDVTGDYTGTRSKTALVTVAIDTLGNVRVVFGLTREVDEKPRLISRPRRDEGVGSSRARRHRRPWK